LPIDVSVPDFFVGPSFYTIFMRARLQWSSLLPEGGEDGGPHVPLAVDRFLRPLGSDRLRLRASAEALMSWLYILIGVIALLITIYLVVALLFPEKF
jgi:K+-transporting ATPase KdpF subunit